MAVKQKTSDLQQIGINIRRLRTEQGISRAQLAYEIETSEKQMSRIENGEINSGILTYIKIIRVLGIKPSDLFHKIKL